MRGRKPSILAVTVAWTLISATSAFGGEPAQYELKIDRQPLSRALQEFAKQSGVQIIFFSKVTDGYEAPSLNGRFTAAAALRRLLNESQLTYREINPKTIEVQSRDAGNQQSPKFTRTAVDDIGPVRLAQATESNENTKTPSPSKGETQGEDRSEGTPSSDGVTVEVRGIPEILVTGSKLGALNMDIERTEDDVQPYVVFDRETIERSGASTLEEFFRNRLSMSTDTRSSSQTVSTTGSTSTIRLRGLRADETLILVDGRRMAGISLESGVAQPDLNGIPLSAIERIEVLPTTASGIYGGSATGGVINIILRRDYSSVDAKVTYENTFGSDVANRRIDLSAGTNWNDARTSLVVTGSYADGNPLLAQERSFVQRAREHILAANPDFYYSDFVPPLGATTNIRSATGAPLTLKDGTALNSPITFVPLGYEGVHVDDGAALVANAGQYNFDLANTAQQGAARQSLVNAPTLWSFMGSVRHEFSPSLNAFLEWNVSSNAGRFLTSQVTTRGIQLDPTAPNNPFEQPIVVTAPTVGADGVLTSESDAQRVATGVIVRLPGGWQSGLDLGWNHSRFAYTLPWFPTTAMRAAVSSGAIDVIRDLNLFPNSFAQEAGVGSLSPANATLKNVSIRVAGPLPWNLPGGHPRIAGLIELRDETFEKTQLTRPDGTGDVYPDRSQDIYSVYLETTVPLISAQNRQWAAQLLELQLAVRRDSYTTRSANASIPLGADPASIVRVENKSSSIDPTVGIKYAPTRDFTLRTSYGTGYLPPSVHHLAPRPPSSFQPGWLRDPRRGNEPLGQIDVLVGGNPNLEPETSRSWSAGVILTPRSLPDLRVSADFTSIRKRNNISSVARLSQSDFDNEQYVPGLILRAPAPPGDPFGVGPVTEINAGLFNIASLQADALDLAVDYDFSIADFGTVNLALSATRLLKLDTQLTKIAPIVENAGVSNLQSEYQGVKWKANALLTWQYRDWTVGWASRFFDSYFLTPDYEVNVNQGSATVPSQMYHDLFSTYRFRGQSGALSSVLANTELSVGIKNVFNKKPPVDVSWDINFSGAGYSTLGDPRLSSFYISVRKGFGGE